MATLTFPQDFLFGTATAAVQIEGGDTHNSWYDWCERGMVPDGSHCITANDHWNRVEQDIKLLQDLGCETYRMGLEWARIEPNPGHFNADALEHYRREIEKLLEAQIIPLVTLHHFSNPQWLEAKGAWTNAEAVNDFQRYTRKVVECLGDLVSDWVTINEPNVYLAMGYIEGIFPPGKKGALGDYFKAASHMIDAHLEAYQTIHQIRTRLGKRDTKVGVAHHLRIFEPAKGTWLERQSCHLYRHLFQDIFLEGMTFGKKRWPLMKGNQNKRGIFADFIGLNYYSRDTIKGSWNPLELFGKREVADGKAVNDLGWEIYPEGIYELCKRLHQAYTLPIYITENGTCDAQDAFRREFIRDHLAQLHRAITEGILVARYYHWTLMDNFEWMEGYAARFGLIHCNFETQERNIRPSGIYFGEVARSKTLEI